jgi:L-iditol 2-dehydrogenase
MTAAEAALKIPAAYARQAVLVEPGRIELREAVAPHPSPGELLIQIRCALSCGTDLKTFLRGHPMWKPPMAFGHEFSGTVAEAGEGVTAFRPGDEIMAAPTAPCGTCFFCQHSQENLCDDAVGRMVHGAYADLLLLPAYVVATNTFHKPADLPFEEAALLEPLSCIVHAQAMARPDRGETAVVLGAGAFGVLHMLALKAAGLREVVVVGRGANRLKWAAEMGADRVVDAQSVDAAAEIARLNGGFGPDLVIECTGHVEGWEDALARVRRGGRVVLFGGCPAGTAVSIDTRRMHYDNLTVMAPFHFRPRDVKRAYDLLKARTLRAGAIVNARMRLAELSEVFQMLERGAVLKCAVIP